MIQRTRSVDEIEINIDDDEFISLKKLTEKRLSEISIIWTGMKNEISVKHNLDELDTVMTFVKLLKGYSETVKYMI